MTPDPFKNLLQEADAAARFRRFEAPDLAGRVRTVARRRRQVQRAGAVIAVIVMVSAGILLAGKQGQPRHTETGTSVLANRGRPSDAAMELRKEVNRLRLEATSRANVAAGIDRHRRRLSRLAAYRRQAAVVSPAMRLQQEIEISAGIMVYQAERLLGRTGDERAAVETYQRAIRLFPDTSHAEVARKRLSETKSDQGAQCDPRPQPDCGTARPSTVTKAWHRRPACEVTGETPVPQSSRATVIFASCEDSQDQGAQT